MIPLEGKTIRLRAVEPSDLDVLYRWENNPENWIVSNTITPFSRHILQKYIESARSDIYEARQLRLMIDRREDGKEQARPIGTIDLFEFDPQHRRAGVGILIADNSERMKGIATEALSIFIEYSFATLQLHHLFCHITEDNSPSIKLFRKFGFREAGILRDWLRISNKWKNVHILQLINPQDA